MCQCYIKESDTEKADYQSLAEESDHDSHGKGSTPKNRQSKEVSPPRKRAQSSDEEEEERTEEEKQQELVSVVINCTLIKHCMQMLTISFPRSKLLSIGKWASVHVEPCGHLTMVAIKS